VCGLIGYSSCPGRKISCGEDQIERRSKISRNDCEQEMYYDGDGWNATGERHDVHFSFVIHLESIFVLLMYRIGCEDVLSLVNSD
jgi:hypothetical protein